MRIVILTEDYVGNLLAMTDCNNEELHKILLQAEENDENGIGKTITEICNELFIDKTFLEIGCTEQSEFYGIKELNSEHLTSTNYLSFSVVKGEIDYE